MRHKLISVCLLAWILFMMPTTAVAQGFDAGRTGSVSITLVERSNKTPIQGAEFALYRVASVTAAGNDDLSYTYTDAFKDFDALPDDPAVAAKLDTYVREHAVSSEKNVTDSQGRTVFHNLPLGLYFVKQTNYVDGYAACKSFVVSVPDQTNGSYTYDVHATPKTETAKFTDITIRKVWDVDEFAKIADHVEVRLLLDGLAVKTAVLSEMNNWEVTYSGMPESDSYSVVELDVPEGFSAVYTRRGYEFTVTNRFHSGSGGNGGGEGGDISDVPGIGEVQDDPALIQTGQLIWPIPVLAMAGLVLLTIGVVILRKTRETHA